jgi:hypothetical protein
MPDTVTEPKQSVDEAIDNSIDQKMEELNKPSEQAPLQDAPQQEASDSSTVESAQETQGEGESDSQKTQGTQEQPEDFKGVEGGFAKHPAWIERENKLKEAQRQAEETQRQLEGYTSLLNDPEIYRRYLIRQGFTKAEVDREMQMRGFPVQEEKAKSSLYQDVARELYGDDLDAMTPEDKQTLKQLVKIIEVANKRQIGSTLQPIQGQFEQQQRQQAVNRQLDEVERLSKEHGFDYDKEVLPGMKLELDSFYKRNPGAKQPPDAVNLYNAFVSRLLLERQKTKGLQEARDAKKANAKPLSQSVPASQKRKDRATPRTPQEVDSDIDSAVDKFYSQAGL